MIVLITDWASHYVTRGIDDAFRQLTPRCYTCQRRAQCTIEPIVPQTMLRNDTSETESLRHVYYPTFYEMADAKNAIETTSSPRVAPLFVVLSSGYTPALLGETFGKDGYCYLRSAADEPHLFELISKKLRS